MSLLNNTYLHDLYKYDSAQIMDSYNDKNDINEDGAADLGLGDINGVMALYGY